DAGHRLFGTISHRLVESRRKSGQSMGLADGDSLPDVHPGDLDGSTSKRSSQSYRARTKVVVKRPSHFRGRPCADEVHAVYLRCITASSFSAQYSAMHEQAITEPSVIRSANRGGRSSTEYCPTPQLRCCRAEEGSWETPQKPGFPSLPLVKISYRFASRLAWQCSPLAESVVGPRWEPGQGPTKIMGRPSAGHVSPHQIEQ